MLSSSFISHSRLPAYADISDSLWSNWIWQQQKRIRTLEELQEHFELTVDEIKGVLATQEKFRMAITPYYASLMDRENPFCPIRRQAIPLIDEMNVKPYEMLDPLAEEANMKVPGITHRYPDRVLFYTTHHCPVYCRHCTRKRKVSDPKTAMTEKALQLGLQYIREHSEIRDVLLSGGDPLSNSDERLEMILKSLREIPHVEIIRLGTRNPVTLPQRITPAFAGILKKFQPIFIQTHFNHPKECTLEAFKACELLADHGSVINNQMVLLRGINDCAKTVQDLNHRLLKMRVQPYYMLQCDLTEGLSHFRTPLHTGTDILQKLIGWTSGLAIPHFVVDLPEGGGKIPLVPQYIQERAGQKVQIRNYRQGQYNYTDVE